jgi:hypothetical protein
MADFAFAEVMRKAAIMSSQGMDVFQKFTCSGCGKRVTRPEPNLFLPTGRCSCGTTTDISRRGCSYEIRNDMAARRP